MRKNVDIEVVFNNIPLNNWSEYIDYKFPKDIFKFENIEEDKHGTSFAINTIIENNKTSIEFYIGEYKLFVIIKNSDSIFLNVDQLDVYDPFLSTDYEKSFNLEGIKEVDNLINIALYSGWKEVTFTLNEVVYYKQLEYFYNEKLTKQTIYRNKYNDLFSGYGCLLFPIFPIMYFYKKWYWGKNEPNLVRTEVFYQPMLSDNKIIW